MDAYYGKLNTATHKDCFLHGVKEWKRKIPPTEVREFVEAKTDALPFKTFLRLSFSYRMD